MIPLRDNIPTGKLPVITIALIVLNVLVFGWQLTFSSSKASNPKLERLGVSERDENSLEFGAIPYRITHPGKDCKVAALPNSAGSKESQVVCQGQEKSREATDSGAEQAGLDEAPWWVTVFTSMFMHGGILHIAFNMLFLWIFGNNVEDALGRVKYLAFYLLAGVAAVYSQSVIDPSSTLPTIGASGAIAGVLGAYALLFPKARVLTLVFIIFFATLIEIPALVMLLIWFVLQFLPAVGQVANPSIGGEGGVAYFAHVGGFIFGLAVALALARLRGVKLGGGATA